jgi:hypothetical protein
MTICELLECYNVAKEEYDEADPRNVQIPEIEGKQAIEGSELESAAYTQLIKTRKANIGTTKNTKFAQIGDNWSEETVEKIANLLREYQDLFPTTFSKMRGIAGDLGEMNIPLKPGAKPVCQRRYRLNLRYKEKVKDEIDRMLEERIIEPIEESEWISLMVVQDKKTRGIRICIDLRKLNDACLHDSFPTPFTDEVLENMGGQETYTFTDGFSGYH